LLARGAQYIDVFSGLISFLLCIGMVRGRMKGIKNLGACNIFFQGGTGLKRKFFCGNQSHALYLMII
jgi:hypothetical protein